MNLFAHAILFPVMLIAVVVNPSIFGHIIPLGSMLPIVFGQRTVLRSFEIIMRHRIQAKDGELSLEEHWLVDQGRSYFIWKGFELPIRAVLEKSSYTFGTALSIPTRSHLVRLYLTTPSAEVFRNQLLSEKFVRTEQFMVFKPTYEPSGDPKLWEVKNNYLPHPDISYRLLAQGITVAVVGFSQGGSKRSIYFDSSFNGITRIEWVDPQGIAAWNFSDFENLPPLKGLYPKRLRLEWNGNTLIRSELISLRPANQKTVREFKNQLRNHEGISPNAQESLKWLLSYR